jgi:chaperonin GroEL (HSP60 family)
VIKVGGASEVEVGEKKDRIDDALNATKAAGAGREGGRGAGQGGAFVVLARELVKAAGAACVTVVLGQRVAFQLPALPLGSC